MKLVSTHVRTHWPSTNGISIAFFSSILFIWHDRRNRWTWRTIRWPARWWRSSRCRRATTLSSPKRASRTAKANSCYVSSPTSTVTFGASVMLLFFYCPLALPKMSVSIFLTIQSTPHREVNEDNMIFRNVTVEAFEDGMKHVSWTVHSEWGTYRCIRLIIIISFLRVVREMKFCP